MLVLAVAATESRAVSTWRAIADSRTNNAVQMLTQSVGWSVGATGAISQTLDGGTTWTPQISNVPYDLKGVWGSDATHVWAVGLSATLLKWDGSSWSKATLPGSFANDLLAVSGLSASSVWAVGKSGTVLYWNGSTWSLQTIPSATTSKDFASVCAVDATHVWAVGTSGTIIKFDGSVWSQQTSTVGTDLTGVWGSSATNVYAVGAAGVLLHSTDGTTWTSLATPSGGSNITGITGADATHMWIIYGSTISFSSNGTAWASQSVVPATQTFNGISAAPGVNFAVAVGIKKSSAVFSAGAAWTNKPSSPVTPVANNAVYLVPTTTTGWAVGDGGLIEHTTDGGTTWTVQTSGVTGNLTGVWASSTTTAWVVGRGGIILKTTNSGGTWTAQTSTVVTDLASVAGNSATSLWAVGASGVILKGDGTNWVAQAAPAGTTTTLFNSVWAIDATHVWAVGASGVIIVFNGTVWATQSSTVTTDLAGVWGTSTTNLYAVGLGGVILHTTDGGTTWAAMISGTTTDNFTSIAGADATHVTAVTSGGSIYFYDGTTTWVKQIVIPTTQGYRGVSAASTTLVIAVGVNKSYAVFKAGGAWNDTASVTPTTGFNCAWGIDDSQIWFGGAGGVVMYWNGVSWTSTATGGGNVLGIWGTDNSNIWAVCANGYIARWDGVNWVSDNSPTGTSLNSVYGTTVNGATEVWAVGNGGIIYHRVGSNWNSVASPVTTNLNGVWFADATHGWAVGGSANSSTAIRYGTVSGVTGWTADFSATSSDDIYAVSGSSATAVWAVGGNGLLERASTTIGWGQQSGGLTTDTMTGVAVVSPTSQWAVGGTTILRGTGTSWLADGAVPVASLPLSKVFATGVNTVFITASNGMVFVNSPPLVPEISVQEPVGVNLDSGLATIDFGIIISPNSSPVKTFSVVNTGATALNNLVVTKDGTGSADYVVSPLSPVGTSLAVGATATFTVTFTPTLAGTRPAALHIGSSDLDEPSFLVNLTGTGRLPPKIVTQPLPKVVNPGTAVTFSVVATGAGPLTYQWQNLAGNIVGQTSSSLKFASVTKGNEDTHYDVVVTDTTTGLSVTSNAVSLSVNNPIIIATPPVAQSAHVGDPVTFSVAVAGSSTLPITYQWRRNSVSIAGATGATFTIPSVQIANAGSYSVLVKNVVGSVISPVPDVALNVGDTGVKVVKVLAGSTATLPALFGGAVTGYTWTKTVGTQPAVNDPRYVGWTAKTLTISKTQVTPIDDSGTYTCVGHFATGDVTATFQVIVYTDVPVITTASPITMPDGIVGGPYNGGMGYQIMVDSSQAKTPTAFAVAGLPTGLTVNPLTGLISGTPAVALTADKTYTLAITVSNAKGKATATASLKIKAPPYGSVGVFVGPIGREAVLSKNLGGRIDITTTTAGGFTGKVTLGATAYSIAGGTLTTDIAGMVKPHGVAVIKRTGLPSLTVTFDIDNTTTNHLLVNGDINDGTAHATFTGWRKKWGTVMPAPEQTDLNTYLGYYTFGMDIPDAQDNVEATPQGMSFGSFTVAPTTGAVTAAGKLADGTTFTCASFAGPHGQVLVFQAPSGTLGSVCGTLTITQGVQPFTPAYGNNTIAGTVSWYRAAVVTTTAHTYKAGFGPMDLTAFGGRYIAPVAPAAVMGLAEDGITTNPNAKLVFSRGGVDSTAVDTTQTHTNPGISLYIKTAGTSALPSSNADYTTLTVTPGTGAFTGTFKVTDTNPAAPATNITRSATFYGILIPDLVNGISGQGYFLLNRRPVVTPVTVPVTPPQLLSNTDVLSGLVLLQKLR